MSTLKQEIEKHIKKLIHPLKDDEELYMILKAKLTKKELKLLQAWSDSDSETEIENKLKIDNERYETLSRNLIKKLNQEKVKQAICL